MKIFIFLALVAVAQAGVNRSHLQAERRTKPLLDNAPVQPGDEVSQHGQFPYQAYLLMDYGISCGGSLVSETVVLTRAGSVEGRNRFDVWLGTQTRSVDEPERVISTTYNKIIHEAYDYLTDENDIAVLILTVPVTFTPFIQPVRLPRISDIGTDFVGVAATISGWRSESGLNDDLRFATMPVITNEECDRYHYLFLDSILCVSYQFGTEACYADHGSPMVYTEDDGEMTQIGVMSETMSMGCTWGPVVYTRVTSHIPWLQANTDLVFRP